MKRSILKYLFYRVYRMYCFEYLACLEYLFCQMKSSHSQQGKKLLGMNDIMWGFHREVRNRQVQEQRKRMREKIFGKRIIRSENEVEMYLIQKLDRADTSLAMVLEESLMALQKGVSQSCMMEILDLVLFRSIEAGFELTSQSIAIHQVFNLLIIHTGSSYLFLYKVCQCMEAYLEMLASIKLPQYNVSTLLKQTIYFISTTTIVVYPQQALLNHAVKLIIGQVGLVDETHMLQLLQTIDYFIDDSYTSINAESKNTMNGMINQTRSNIRDLFMFLGRVKFESVKKIAPFLKKYFKVMEKYLLSTEQNFLQIEQECLEENTLLFVMLSLTSSMLKLQQSDFIFVHYRFIRVLKIILHFDCKSRFAALYSSSELQTYLLSCIFQAHNKKLEEKVLDFIHFIARKYGINVDSERNLLRRYCIQMMLNITTSPQSVK